HRLDETRLAGASVGPARSRAASRAEARLRPEGPAQPGEEELAAAESAIAAVAATFSDSTSPEIGIVATSSQLATISSGTPSAAVRRIAPTFPGSATRQSASPSTRALPGRSARR